MKADSVVFRTNADCLLSVEKNNGGNTDFPISLYMAGKCLGYFNNNKKTTNALSDSESFTQEVTVSETSTTTITTSNTSKPNSDFKTVPEARGGKCSNLRSVFNLILTAIGEYFTELTTTP